LKLQYKKFTLGEKSQQFMLQQVKPFQLTFFSALKAFLLKEISFDNI